MELVVRSVDNGIGGYEFWGAPGTDHAYALELQVSEAVIRLDADDEPLSDLLIPAVLAGEHYGCETGLEPLRWKATLKAVNLGDKPHTVTYEMLEL